MSSSTPIPIEELKDIRSIIKRFQQDEPTASKEDVQSWAKDQLIANNLLREERERTKHATSHSTQQQQVVTGEVSDNATSSYGIPRDVQRRVEIMPKLTKENWHGWLRDLKFALKGVPLLGDIIFGDVDANHPRYNRQLDEALVGLIRIACDKTGSNNVSRLIDAREDWGAREMIAYMGEELTKANEIAKGQVLMDLSRVRVVNNDIDQLLHDIDAITRRGTLLGMDVSSDQKVVQLANCSRYGPFRSVWEQLETQGTASDFDSVVAALLARHRAVKVANLNREARAAALKARATRDNGVRRSNKGPCYKCGQDGHIARDCARENKENIKTGTRAKEATAQASPASAGGDDKMKMD